MNKNLKNLFSEDIQGLLSEDSLNAIEEAFDKRVELAVGTALEEQDEIYSTRLKELLEALDTDRAKKVQNLVKRLDESHAKTFLQMSKKFQKENKEGARKFKDMVVESVSVYLDEYLNETVSKEDFSQSVKNNTAYTVLENLRKVLSIDSAAMNPQVKEAIMDGKSQIDTLKNENKQLKDKYTTLVEKYSRMETKALLEEKTAKFSETKKGFVMKALGDKNIKFIQENFEYTARLFDKQEKTKLQTLKEEAFTKRTVRPDFVPAINKVEKTEKVVEENVNNFMDDYLSGLSRGKGEI